MRGTIEIDKDRYPYAGSRFGDSYYITYMPGVTKAMEVPLPLFVANAAAALVNAEYHSKNPPSINLEFIKDCTRTALARAYIDGDLDGARYSQIKKLLA